MFQGLQVPRVVQQQANLSPDRLERLDLLGLELSALLPPHEIEATGGFLVHDQRDHQGGTVRKAGEEAVSEPRVSGGVISPHEALVVEKNTAEPKLLEGHRGCRECLNEQLRHVVAGDRTHLTARAVKEIGRDRVGTGKSGEFAADQTERLGEIRGGAQDPCNG